MSRRPARPSVGISDFGTWRLLEPGGATTLAEFSVARASYGMHISRSAAWPGWPGHGEDQDEMGIRLWRRQGRWRGQFEGLARRQGREPGRDEQSRLARPTWLHRYDRSLHLLLRPRADLSGRLESGGRGGD